MVKFAHQTIFKYVLVDTAIYEDFLTEQEGL